MRTTDKIISLLDKFEDTDSNWLSEMVIRKMCVYIFKNIPQFMLSRK